MLKNIFKTHYFHTKAFDAIVSKFPESYSFAFAYGSGVFPQSTGLNTEKKMTDFIFAVDDSLTFHKQNMKCNFSHYSFLKYAGSEIVKEIQEGFGSKMYFNTLIEVENTLIKYGVISTNHLIEDLLDWQTLYVSGRLHKPVNVIKEPESNDLIRALNTNLKSALHAALLYLPESFSEEQLFLKIVGLSYNGDFRMYVGEDKRKVENIVKNQMPYFRKMYDEHIRIMPLLHWKQNQGVIEQDCSYESTLYHLNLLPKKVQHNILINWSTDGRYRDIEDVLLALACHVDCSDMVERAIQNIVWWPSITQSAKGILTAGIIKSLKYSSTKMRKMFRSLNLYNKH